MERIYIDADDKFVGSFVVYGSGSKVYVDAAHTQQADKDEVTNAFKKGVLLVNDSNKFYRPVYVTATALGILTNSSGSGAIVEFTL